MKRLPSFFLFSLFPLALAAPSPAADAESSWTQHCIRCHGEDGKGMTKTGRKLRVKDLTLDKTQRRLSDEEIADFIATGSKDNSGEERMPAFGEKFSEEERKALVTFIRGLRNAPAPR